MTYADVLQFIESTEKFGIKPGLDATRRLLAKLGNPQNDLSVVHIAGTNGKGSTASFIKSMLMQEGYRVGLYTSPSLFALEERIQINGQMIDQDAFINVAGCVKAACEELVDEGHDPNTEFEIFTAMAFLHFSRKAVDFVILEVGLGGRLDATNVVDKPLVSVITPIALDHVNILGDSVGKVAFEKGGIIKREVPVVIHPQEYDAAQVLQEIAGKLGSDLIVAPVDMVDVKSISLEGTVFEFGARSFKLGMIGAHQARNAVVAMTVVETLRREYGVGISEEAIEKGLEVTKWPCRLEVLDLNIKTILDGAHNPHGAHALCASLDKIIDKDKSVKVLIGMLADKDVDEVLEIMQPYLKHVVVTEPQSDRRIEAGLLAEKIGVYSEDVQVEKTPIEAYHRVISAAAPDDIVLIFGSFYLVGHIRQEALYGHVN